MLTFKTDTPSSCGIVEIDDQHIVRVFHEIVDDQPGKRANGALYAFKPPLLDHLNHMSLSTSDFSTETIPRLMGRIETCHTDQRYLEFGTHEARAAAQWRVNQHL